jgi:saccharopine dehydrogenase (NADP+, L-glutamate forming)
MKKNILLFGAGKSATVLIDFLIKEASVENWHIAIVDANKEVILQKTNNINLATAHSFNIETDTIARQSLIENADIVISLLPPHLHILVAKDCIKYKKNLLTASYVDTTIKALEQDIVQNDLIFLCEMGLDPGIDHMSAIELIHNIKAQGGIIISFKSHCGGLVAPESDDNPWHYKISWNPRNVVMAGKAGAEFLQNAVKNKVLYKEMFTAINEVQVTSLSTLAYYPNRDSLSYIPIYNLQNATTFIRTTLRHPDFIKAWQAVISLQLTNEEKLYDSTLFSCKEIFTQHIAKLNLKDTLHQLLQDEKIAKALYFLQLHTNALLFNKGMISIADVLQFALEQNLKLQPEDKDMIVMQHEIGYTLNNESKQVTSTLIVKGEDANRTAMAKTVGLPLGIAAKLILNGSITSKGLQIPISKEIYKPVLRELAKNGIVFKES